jgi:hypothetical protein
MPQLKTWKDSRLLGKTFVNRQNEAVLVIGKHSWTRQQMVEQLKCGNFRSARILSRAAASLGVVDADDMAKAVSLEDLFAQRDVGVTTIYTWMCVLSAIRENPLKWIGHKDTTLDTQKRRWARERKAK